jgi:hypothetical protein
VGFVSKSIDVAQLTSFETAVDGSAIKMHMEDSAGQAFSICFPVDCLRSLLMTLPKMVTGAVQRRYNDPRLRVTYPVDTFQIELGSDLCTRILTLATPDGFAVSFSLTEEQCQEIGLAETETTESGSAQFHVN